MDDRRSVLVIGENSFPYHRFEEKETAFETILDFGGEVVTTTDREALMALPGDDYDTVVDFLTDSTLSDPQRDGLLGVETS